MLRAVGRAFDARLAAERGSRDVSASDRIDVVVFVGILRYGLLLLGTVLEALAMSGTALPRSKPLRPRRPVRSVVCYEIAKARFRPLLHGDYCMSGSNTVKV